MIRSGSVPARVTRVVILGGGFGGVNTARHLERLLRRRRDVEIVLISRDNYFLMTPLLFEVCTGALGLYDCSAPIRSVLRSTRVIEATVRAVDLDHRTVTLAAGGEERDVGYDHLVLALGAVTNQRSIPGAETALTFKTLTDAAVLRNHVLEQLERADTETDPARKRRRLTFAVIGGGLVGVELFGELTAFVRKILRLYSRISEDELRFVLLEYGTRVLPEVDPDLAEYATAVLRRRPGVEVRTGAGVTRVEPGRVVLGETAIEAETIVLTAGILPNPLVATLPLTRDRRQRVVVEATMRSPDRAEVWALGDCAAVPDPHGTPYPCLAQHAMREAKVLARNIAAVLAGREPEPFVYGTLGIMASLGPGKGLGTLLNLRMRGLLAWWVRRGYYLMTMPGWDRRLRILADWAVALVARPDVGKIDLDAETARFVRDHLSGSTESASNSRPEPVEANSASPRTHS
ncbi:MAG: Pyridine nucleotide-disulfide oxidoreductase, FAD/NAD(P)-binding domain protein [Gemmataceae bacterium]|nr:Pyridine nucleotide-disulfide oxidoreductase, FAD/NAD(P)-binding domain protein [Gemmataceae bacterium]